MLRNLFRNIQQSINMRALKIIGILVGAIIAVLLILGLVLPKEMTVDRSITIDAPVAQVFPHLQYFAKTDAWSPWNKMDPNMEKSIEGEDGTVGAISRWSGNKDVGVGYQKITAIDPGKRVDLDLVFEEPWESQADIYIQAEEVEDGTKVTWGFRSDTPIPENIMMAMMGMRKALSQDYDEGLSMLKEVVESEEPVTSYNGYEIKTVDLPYQHFVAHRSTIGMNQITAVYTEYLPKIFAAVQSSGTEMAGMPCGLFYSWDESTGQTDMASAIPVKTKTEIEGFTALEVPSEKSLLVDYYGGYHGTGAAHEAIDAYIKANGIKVSTPAIEEYATDPGEEPDSTKWLTRVYYPIEL